MGDAGEIEKLRAEVCKLKQENANLRAMLKQKGMTDKEIDDPFSEVNADFGIDIAGETGKMELAIDARKVGRKCGSDWAKEHATAEVLARLRDISECTLDDWVDNDSESSGHDLTEDARLEVYEAIHGNIHEPAENEDRYYVSNLTYEFFSDLDAGDWAHRWSIFYVGFVEGVIRYVDSEIR